MCTRCSREQGVFVDKLFRWIKGNKPTPEKAVDIANTAPLTEEQLKAIVGNQNPQFDLQQLIAAAGQSVAGETGR